jgi:hypothetical protein
MNYKVIILLTVFSSLLSCSPEMSKLKPESPAIFIEQIHFVLKENKSERLKGLFVDKNDLITTLTEENKEVVFAYDSHFFNMATDNKLFSQYKRDLVKSIRMIKKSPLNWKHIQIQKASYETDSLQINIQGLLIVKDNKNTLDSINFKGVRLQKYWSLTKLY